MPAPVLLTLCTAALVPLAAPPPAAAQGGVVELTLESMIERGLSDSYRVRQLQLAIDRRRSLLQAEEAGLKSRVELLVAAPEFEALSEYKWNSTLQRNELIHENTRRWQLDLSVRQPVILFGYPTNGYLSLNERAAAITRELAAADTTRANDADLLQVELVNAREQRQQAASEFRRRAAVLKQRLRLATSDSIVVDPTLNIAPVAVDANRAVRLATNLAPRLRRIAIDRRENELELDEAHGENSFRMDLALTYGRESQDPRLQRLWEEPQNSYTVQLTGRVPIWDWGERKHRVQAERIAVQATDVAAEAVRAEIETNVANEIRNLEEYEQRALDMQRNLELARQITMTTLGRYGAGEAALIELVRAIEREADTAGNLLDAYLGYRRALLRLQRLTYYDFERNMPLLDRFRVPPPSSEGT